MQTTDTSNDQHWLDLDRLHRIVAILLALLLLLTWWLGHPTADRPGWCASANGGCAAVAAAPAADAVAAPVAAAPVVVAPAAAAPEAAVAPAAAPVAAAPVDVPPAARVYFGVNRTAVSAQGNAALADVIAYLKSHAAAKAHVSGFHDARGSAARNAALAQERAEAVSAVLAAAGISGDRIVMDKPSQSVGSGSNDEARRVEVSVEP